MSRQRDKAWRQLVEMPVHPQDAVLAVSNVNAERVRCGIPGCMCSHVGCVGGWIDHVKDDGTHLGHDIAVPCPGCRPGLARHLAGGGTPATWRHNND